MTLDRSDEGATLVEMIVVVLILAIIMGPLSASVISGLFSTEQAAHRTANTTDQQLLASYFANDVQSADDVSVPATPGCGATGTTVVQFHWVDPNPAGAIDKTAAYVASGGALVRAYCEVGGSSKSIPLVGAMGSTPTAMCTTAGVTAPCAPAAGAPQSVSLTVVATGSTSDASFDSYTIQLSGTRRVTA